MPILANAFQKLPLPAFAWKCQRNLVNLGLIVALILPVIFTQPWWVDQITLPEKFAKQYQQDSSNGPLIDAKTPLEAIEYLRKTPGGNLFNDMSYGSYIIWALPEQMVFIDPRIELYPAELWLDYIRISAAIPGWEEQLEGYGIQTLMLSPQEQAGLIQAAQASGRWREIYSDTASVILVGGD